MFATWFDALRALAVILIITILTRSQISFRGAKARRRYTPGELMPWAPEGFVDVRDTAASQRAGDTKDGKTMRRVAVVTAAVCQLLPLSAPEAVTLTIAAATVVDLARRTTAKVTVGMLRYEDSFTHSTVLGEVREILRFALTPKTANPFRGRWIPLGLLAALVSTAMAIIGWYALFASTGINFREIDAPLADLMPAVRFVVLATVGLLLLLAARQPLDLARRIALRRPGATDQFDVLYLRSFSDDRLTLLATGDTRGMVDILTLRYRHSYERLLVAAMEIIGRVVAVGEPGERIPPLGAFRVYYDHDEWQGHIVRMLRAARFVILSLGETPSVAWEVARMRELGILDKALFLVPPVPESVRATRFERLAELLDLPATSVAQPSDASGTRIGLLFSEGKPMVIVSNTIDYSSYYCAVIEAGLPHFPD